MKRGTPGALAVARYEPAGTLPGCWAQPKQWTLHVQYAGSSH